MKGRVDWFDWLDWAFSGWRYTFGLLLLCAAWLGVSLLLARALQALFG